MEVYHTRATREDNEGESAGLRRYGVKRERATSLWDASVIQATSRYRHRHRHTGKNPTATFEDRRPKGNLFSYFFFSKCNVKKILVV